MKYKFKKETIFDRKRSFLIILITTIMMCLLVPLYVTADTVSNNDIDALDNQSTVSGDNSDILDCSNEVSSNAHIASNNNNVDSDDNITTFNNNTTVSDNDTTILDSNTIVSEEENEFAYSYDKFLGEQNYNIYETQLNAQLMDEKLKYLEGVELEWGERLAIEEKKMELGYSTSVEVAEIRNQHRSIQLQMEETKEIKNFYIDCIVLYGCQYEEISVSDEWIPLNADYISKYKESSSQIKSFQEEINKYKEQIQLVTPGTEEALACEIQLQMAEYSLVQQEISLEIYVRELQLQYNNLGRKIEDTNNQISVLQTKAKNAQLLLEKGKITKVELMSLENELKGLEYERISFLYDASKIRYILNNTIQNQII